MDKTALKQISAAVKAAPGQSWPAMPLLAAIRVSCRENAFSIEKTDLTTFTRIEVSNDGTPTGDALVNEKLFHGAIKALNGNTDVSFVGEGLRVGTMALASAGDTSDWPVAWDIEDNGTSFEADAAQFAAYCAGPLNAACGDSSRFNLDMVFFDGAGAAIIGTDGHRLDLEKPSWLSGLRKSALIPRAALAAVIKVGSLLKVKEWRVEFSGNTDYDGNNRHSDMRAVDGSARIATFTAYVNKGAYSVQMRVRCGEGEYPDYRKVIPSDISEPVVVNRADLQAALAEMKPFINDGKGTRNTAIALEIENEALRLSTEHKDLGGHAAIVPTVGGAAFEITPVELNWFYLMDMVDTAKAAGESYVSICFHGEKAPAVFNQSHDGLHLIMPMRKDNGAAKTWRPSVDAAADPSTETTAPVEAPAETEPPAETPEPVAASEPEPVSETPVESAPPVNDLRAEMIRRARNITAPPAMKKEPTVKTKPARETTKAARARVARENMRDGNRAHGRHERPAPVETPPEPAHEPAPPLPKPERRSVHWAPPKRTPEPAVLPTVVPARIVPKPELASPVDDTRVPIRVVDEPEPVERSAGFLAGFRKVRDMIREYLRPATPATVIEPLPEPVSAPVSETKDERERPSGRPVPTTTPEPKKSRKGIMRAKYDGICKVCGEPIEVGDEIRYYGRKWGAKHAGCDDRTEEQRRADSERARAHRRAYRRNAA